VISCSLDLGKFFAGGCNASMIGWGVPSTRALAHAPWSASKIQTALRCPREFHYRYVDKIAEPDAAPEARVGKTVHAVLEKALSGTPLAEALHEGSAQMLSEVERSRYEALSPGVGAFLDKIEAFRRRRRVGRQMLEFSLAVREDFSVTQFHAPDAFFRGIFDAGYFFEDAKLAVIDHKCGERRVSASFAEQLEGYAVLATAQFRSLRQLWLGVYWVQDGELEWATPIEPLAVRQVLVPRVMENIEAAALAVDDGPRPAPSNWCLLCSYRSICPAAHDLLLEPVEDDEEPDW
jgi:CRISPR/Cas system-associated exonuclease Cas4 (RecB family)